MIKCPLERLKRKLRINYHGNKKNASKGKYERHGGIWGDRCDFFPARQKDCRGIAKKYKLHGPVPVKAGKM